MSASVGPRGGPRPPTAPPSMPELPDLSHLTEEERKIIMAVMVRQKEEEAKEEAMLKEEKPIEAKTVHLLGKKPPPQNDISRLQQQFETYKEQVRRIGEDTRRQQGQHKDDAPTCGICHKTKFADGCGHPCSYCQTKFCARCGGRVSLRSNNEDKVVMWVCNLCRKQQEILTKSGEWFPGRGGKPPGLGAAVSDPAMCAEAEREKKVRSRSQIPLGSQDAPPPAPADPRKGPDSAPTESPTLRSRSEPPRDRKRPVSVPEQNGRSGVQAERQRGPGKLPSQASEERREGRRLTKARSQEHPSTEPEGG
ncbi:regulating synaptic membrane exocytosis protein 1-like, partial [Megalops cyprinoides]|uniref:regulating synaptic membrane exocytosis protein 1-like n=1 Tax=Megalops cyprinoides TaxID=118141 RepID=UPI001865669C